MAKLPTTVLPRSSLLPSAASPALLLTSAPRPSIQTRFHQRQQVRHATEVARPKRAFTWTQIVQLSDGSTYTTRSTSPLPVYRSTKDTRNHLKWQPSEASLQNVEVDEGGKLAGFRSRFGLGYDLAGGVETTKKEEAQDSERGRRSKQKVGKKARAAAEARKKKRGEEPEEAPTVVVEEEDSFTSLLGSYVVDQPHLKGGQVSVKTSSKKGKK